MSISLKKGQPEDLVNDEVTFKVNWALAQHAKGRLGMKPKLDLDISVAGLTATGDVQAFCFYGFDKAAQGSLLHQGDVAAKGTDWFNETILVKLPQVPADYNVLVFVLNSFKKAKFENLGEAYSEVLRGNDVVATAGLSLLSGSNCYAVVAFKRSDSGWSMVNLSEGGNINQGVGLVQDQDAVKRFAQQVALSHGLVSH